MDDAEAIYQIRTHLLYELKWMIHAATEFAAGRAGDHPVALITSAVVHARNLFEFAGMQPDPKGRYFTLTALHASARPDSTWGRFVNNRVTHMYYREHDRPPWPEGLDNDRPDRLVAMANVALKQLEQALPEVEPETVRSALGEVLAASRVYLDNPSPEAHDTLAARYDDSRDARPY